MTNTKLLKEKINKKGLKNAFIAEKMSLSPYGLALKINDINEFKASEIALLCEILEISGEEMEEIFFAKNDDLQSTKEAK